MARTLHSLSDHAALGPRVVTALIGGPLLLLVVYAGGLAWIALSALIVIIGAIEFTRLHNLSRTAQACLIIGALAMTAIVAWVPASGLPWMLAGAGVVVVGMGIRGLRGKRSLQPSGWMQPVWATVALGMAYLGAPTGILIRWRERMGFEAVVAFLMLVWANDVAAYFVGLGLGRHKLAPQISPGKSWEGAAAGLSAAAVLGVGLGPLLGLTTPGALFFGVATSVASQLGDLFESAMKRGAGVKDSGTLLPGHGGLLDRFDGILFAAPVGYVLLRLWGRSG